MQNTGENSKIDLGRRRFTRGGLSTSVVLGSLISEPVLGAAPYNCTISGKMSGNTSVPRERFDCSKLGRSPGYWKTDKSDWGVYVKGDPGIVNNSDKKKECPSSQTISGTTFNSTFQNQPAFFYKNCTVYDWVETRPPGCSAATMLQVLMTGGGLNDSTYKALGRAAVASLLNASSSVYGPNYPLTPTQVIEMFLAVYKGGLYLVPNTTVYWNQNQVKDYWESLYGGL